MPRFILLFLVASLAVLGGCETAMHTAGKPLPVMTFDHLQPISIRAGMLKTHDEDDGYISESFVVSPHQALREYLHARFQPNGFDGTLQATIEDASLRHSYESSPSNVNKYLKVGGVDVYDMTVLLKLEHLGKTGKGVVNKGAVNKNMDGKLEYGTILTVRRIVNVSEHASIAERERAQYEAMEGLFKDLDREVLRIVLGDMGLGLARR